MTGTKVRKLKACSKAQIKPRFKKANTKAPKPGKPLSDSDFFEPQPACFEEYRVEHEKSATAITQRHNALAHEISTAMHNHSHQPKHRTTLAELEDLKTAVLASAKTFADRESFDSASVRNKLKRYAGTLCDEEGELWRGVLRTCVENSYAWRALEGYLARVRVEELEERWRGIVVAGEGGCGGGGGE